MPARSSLPKWPTLTLEREAGGVVCGVDEVGYAALAGPIVTAAVILPVGAKPRQLRGLTDSKLLPRAARERYAKIIRRLARVAVGMASVEEIDRLNIFHANMLAMGRAVEALGVTPDTALVDGRASPPLACRVRPVVKGDRRSLSIAAASVVAKVARDRLMRELAPAYPGYGWETNVGYGTDEHYLGLLRKGSTMHHRQSFAPLNTLFGGRDRALAGLRFGAPDGGPEIRRLRLIELRQDLYAVFDGGRHHLGQVKNIRGRWRFQSVGYEAGEPVLGRGPCAACHAQPVSGPERRFVMRLLRTGLSAPDSGSG